MGRLSLRVAERRGVSYGDVERSRRATSDARHESLAQHVQWHDEQSVIDDGARWILQGDEQESENRTAGVKALHSVPAATTSGRAKELVKQMLSERNGMIAFGRIRERFGKTAGVAKLSNVFQFQWTSPDSLEDND